MPQGLRYLVLSVKSQTQAMLASMSYSQQNISTDMLSLCEQMQMRRSGLKDKKVVCVRESAGLTTISSQFIQANTFLPWSEKTTTFTPPQEKVL